MTRIRRSVADTITEDSHKEHKDRCHSLCAAVQVPNHFLWHKVKE
jgi:hypothetical protein